MFRACGAASLASHDERLGQEVKLIAPEAVAVRQKGKKNDDAALCVTGPGQDQVRDDKRVEQQPFALIRTVGWSRGRRGLAKAYVTGKRVRLKRAKGCTISESWTGSSAESIPPRADHGVLITARGARISLHREARHFAAWLGLVTRSTRCGRTLGVNQDSRHAEIRSCYAGTATDRGRALERNEGFGYKA